MCYVQHFLSPYIDSEVNHKRHFIKIPFINKGMGFINLHSISDFFLSFTINIAIKPIRSTIFDFNKIVTDINIDSNSTYS